MKAFWSDVVLVINLWAIDLFSVIIDVPVKVLGSTSACGAMPVGTPFCISVGGAPFWLPLGGAPLGAPTGGWPAGGLPCGAPFGGVLPWADGTVGACSVVVTTATLVFACVSAAKVGMKANVDKAAPNTAGSTQRRNFLYCMLFLCVLCLFFMVVLFIISISIVTLKIIKL